MTETNIVTESEQIQHKYEELIAACKQRIALSPKDEDEIHRAFIMARDAHNGVRRKSGEPYIFHPLAVAQIAVEEVGLGATAAICALLHDVVEDTEIGLDQIRLLFGDRVALIVDGVTKIDSATLHLQSGVGEDGITVTIGSKQAENYRKILLAMCDDVYVIFLKLCDRLHNMRTLGSMKDTKRYAISSETQYLYIPLAHRLGLYSIKTELEELVMKYTNPVKYAEIVEKINASAGTEERLKVFFTAPIHKLLAENGYQYELKTRIKTAYSCWKKMQNKGVEFDEIYDLYAMRIILDTDDKAECFKVYQLITSQFHPNRSRTRDWITTPKTNGYESLHTTVMSPIGRWVEVQIRTRHMDEVAEKGIAAHFLYKEAHPGEVKMADTAVEDWLRQIRSTLESTEKSALDLVEEFKETLYTKEIYIFTPKGETIKLPSHSTVLDFAFAIHTQLGYSCLGAKVNSRVVPPNFMLHSGEQVQVITSRTVQPEDSWLDFVRTSRAKDHIRDYLRRQRKSYKEEGECKLKALFERLDIRENEENYNRLRRYCKLESDIDLWYRVATGDITETVLSHCFGISNGVQTTIFRQIDQPFLLDQKYADFEAHAATCCKPVQGDEVVGIIENGKVAIHRSNCPHAMHEMSTHEERTVRAKWRHGEKVKLLTGITLTTIDRQGILQELSQVITNNMNLNMRAITLEASDGVVRGTVMLYVDNLEVLQTLIDNIRSIDGVERVARM